MSIKISVIVPYYNVKEELLLRCVNSILAQTFQDYEVILINDGSSEEFLPVLEKAEQLDQRIRIITQQNQGVSAARNHGVAASKGEYIIFVDADDLVLPYFFEEAIHLITQTESDFVIGGNAHLELYQQKNVSTTEAFETEVFSGDDRANFKPYLLGSLYRFGSDDGYIGRGPVSRILKREFALSTPFDTSLPIGEDIIWNLQLMEKCSKVCVAQRIWYLYYANSTSATHKFNENVVAISEKQLNMFKEYIDFNSDAQFSSYCARILEELQRIYDHYLSSPQCPLDKKEKKALIHKLYHAPLWTPAGEKRFYQSAPKKIKIKSLLYKYKLLFCCFQIMRLIKK